MTVKDNANGLSYEVDYETEGDGSGPFYSPMHGADSGDPLVVLVLRAWHDEYGDVVLDADEEELMAEYICENHQFDDFQYDEDEY